MSLRQPAGARCSDVFDVHRHRLVGDSEVLGDRFFAATRVPLDRPQQTVPL